MAGFQGGGHDDDVLASINMVPMIDIVLVLLIIFIVTASAIVKAAISVDLPKTATSESASRPPMAIIMSCREKQAEVAADGQCSPGPVLVDGEPVVDLAIEGATIDPLLQLVRTRVKEAANEPPAEGQTKPPGLTVLITADKDIRFKHVIWMMDLLKNEKVSSVMFNSELFTRGDNPRALPR